MLAGLLIYIPAAHAEPCADVVKIQLGNLPVSGNDPASGYWCGTLSGDQHTAQAGARISDVGSGTANVIYYENWDDGSATRVVEEQAKVENRVISFNDGQSTSFTLQIEDGTILVGRTGDGSGGNARSSSGVLKKFVP
jgi:hypothetical protein